MAPAVRYSVVELDAYGRENLKNAFHATKTLIEQGKMKTSCTNLHNMEYLFMPTDHMGFVMRSEDDQINGDTRIEKGQALAFTTFVVLDRKIYISIAFTLHGGQNLNAMEVLFRTILSRFPGFEITFMAKAPFDLGRNASIVNPVMLQYMEIALNKAIEYQESQKNQEPQVSMLSDFGKDKLLAQWEETLSAIANERMKTSATNLQDVANMIRTYDGVVFHQGDQAFAFTLFSWEQEQFVCQLQFTLFGGEKRNAFEVMWKYINGKYGSPHGKPVKINVNPVMNEKMASYVQTAREKV